MVVQGVQLLYTNRPLGDVMLFRVFNVASNDIGGAGYIAGTNNGIVTVTGQPASRQIVVLDAKTLTLQIITKSFANGRYLIAGLNPNNTYLVMARDYNKEYEPAVWDYVTPATDLTISQQQELWQSWQTST